MAASARASNEILFMPIPTRRPFYRDAYSMVELLVVLAIITLLLGMLLPAVHTVRQRARELVCKNNLHQISIAIANFRQAHKKIPGPGTSGKVGGWTIELLPFLEQKNLWDQIAPGSPILNAPDILLRKPRIFRCPFREVMDDVAEAKMQNSHYVLVPTRGRKSCYVFDAPINLLTPWAGGPEMDYRQVVNSTGPHHGGFFYASNSESVSFMLNGQDVR